MTSSRKVRVKKIVGLGALVASLSISIYLAWFYFIMPRLITNQRSTLEQAFLHSSPQNYVSLSQSNSSDFEGVVIGGILYPSSYAGESESDEISTIQLPSREERRGIEVFLTVPELEIDDARVRLEVDGTQENIYNTVLREAVAHFSGTAYPGEKGNVFLFGHSKLPILAGTDYESIFTNLPRLKNGAVIEVTQGSTIYKYRVNSTAVLTPRDVFILNQPENERLLTLMTCIPPGFNSKRYVAVASLVGVESV